MRRCGEREFDDGFLKRFFFLCWSFLVESYSICELFGDKMYAFIDAFKKLAAFF